MQLFVSGVVNCEDCECQSPPVYFWPCSLMLSIDTICQFVCRFVNIKLAFGCLFTLNFI